LTVLKQNDLNPDLHIESNAPVVIFCYNRVEHLKQTVEALRENYISPDSDLCIFSDGYRDEKDKDEVLQVRNYIRAIEGFKNVIIIERETNWGLANSVIDGVTWIINKYGRVIVIEDDIVTSPFFLTYMNQCLAIYNKDERVFTISGYSPTLKQSEFIDQDIFLFSRISSWGWGTWDDRWNSVDWDVRDLNSFIHKKEDVKRFNQGGMDLMPMLLNQQEGRINSWAVRFSYSCFKQGKYCIYPKYSLVKNIGADGSGTHIKKTSKYENKLYFKDLIITENVKEHELINTEFRKYFQQAFYRKIINFIKQELYIFNHG